MDSSTQFQPLNSLSMDAPWGWLGAGWRDMMRAPLLSLGYGAIVVGMGVVLIALLWYSGLSALIPVAFGMFAFVGPLLAVGLYEKSRRLEAGKDPRLTPVKFASPGSRLQLAYIGFLLMFAAMVWGLVAIVLYALFSAGSYMPLNDFLSFSISTVPGLAMITVGTIAGGFIAFSIFLATVVSIPMLMNDRTDAFTAIAMGIKSFKKNPATMMLWAWLIAIITAAGVATLFIGLVVVFPLLGHASWHAYRDIVRQV